MLIFVVFSDDLLFMEPAKHSLSVSCQDKQGLGVLDFNLSNYFLPWEISVAISGSHQCCQIQGACLQGASSGS